METVRPLLHTNTKAFTRRRNRWIFLARHSSSNYELLVDRVTWLWKHVLRPGEGSLRSCPLKLGYPPLLTFRPDCSKFRLTLQINPVAHFVLQNAFLAILLAEASEGICSFFFFFPSFFFCERERFILLTRASSRYYIVPFFARTILSSILSPTIRSYIDNAAYTRLNIEYVEYRCLFDIFLD